MNKKAASAALRKCNEEQQDIDKQRIFLIKDAIFKQQNFAKNRIDLMIDLQQELKKILDLIRIEEHTRSRN